MATIPQCGPIQSIVIQIILENTYSRAEIQTRILIQRFTIFFSKKVLQDEAAFDFASADYLF